MLDFALHCLVLDIFLLVAVAVLLVLLVIRFFFLLVVRGLFALGLGLVLDNALGAKLTAAAASLVLALLNM